MDRYLIETPHTASECLDLLKLLNAPVYGILTGDAKLGSTVDGPSFKRKMRHRLASGTALVRNRALIIKLNKFDATCVKDYEKQVADAVRFVSR